MRAGAAKHVGVKVVPTEIAHQKRSHAAFAGAMQTSTVLGTARWKGECDTATIFGGAERVGREEGFAGKAVSMV